MERLLSILLSSVVLTILVTAAFAVSPYMGLAMVAVIIYFSVFI